MVNGKKIFLCLLSAVLLILSFPVFNIEFCAWLGFIPLFFVIQNESKSKAFLFAYITGIIFWAGTIYWLIHVALIGLILLVLYLALYFGLFGILFKLTIKDYRLSVVTIPAAWVFLEFLRSRLLTGFPWALLGYSQYLNLPIIQIADITGVWAVSFLVMMVNVAVYNVIARRVAPKQSLKRLLRFARNDNVALLLPFLLVFLSLGYGFYKLHNSKLQTPNSKLRVSVIQGSIPQYQKWSEAFKESISQRYEMLTKEAAKDNPDLIIWPETSVPGIIGEEPGLLERVVRLAQDVDAPLLIGAVTSNSNNYYNSALLISKDGKILSQYDKLHLVPFGEYVPLERHFPFLRQLIGIPIGDFSPGKEYTVFEIQNPKSLPDRQAGKIQNDFAALICFEDTIPELSRRFVKQGAKFLVNITNDAWFKDSSAPYQHAQASVFRAVENRVPVVRAANTGLSCFIDSNGRIYDKVSDGKKDIFVVGYKTKEILLK